MESSSSVALPLKTRLTLTLASTISNAAIRSDGTINRRLLKLISFRSPPNPNPINGVKTSDVTVDPSRNLWFRLFVPTTTTTTTSDLPVIVYFHGGGFSLHSPDVKNFDFLCRELAREISAIVVSVNYRLTPEHRFPAQYDDGSDVLKFLDQNGGGILPENADLSRCFIAGDSAGGNIAHHVAKRATESTFRWVKVIGLVTIQPFFGGEECTESEKRLTGSYLISMNRMDWHWKAFMPEGKEGWDRDHEVINVSGPRAAEISRLAGFPPTIVVVGGMDPLQDRQRSYYDWLKKSGKEAKLIEFPSMDHGFYAFPELPQAAQLISKIKHFVHSFPLPS